MATWKTTWRKLIGETPERRAELRKEELLQALTVAINSWPGIVTAHRDERKVKVVVDDEGQALAIRVWIEVKPADLAELKAVEKRREAAAEVFEKKAQGMRAAPKVQGNLNIKLDQEQLVEMMAGKKRKG